MLHKLALSIVFIYCIFISVQSVNAASPLPQQTLKIVLNQENPTKLTTQNLFIETGNPILYQTNPVANFYELKITGADNAVLFEGKISYDTTTIEDVITVTPAPRNIGLPSFSSLTLYLPYYAEAERVKMYDEKGTLLLDINLLTYGIGSTKRYAECDQCGYCKGGQVPQKWNTCRECLYPSASTDAVSGETLLIEDQTGEPIKPQVGAFYSDLGCVRSPMGFQTEQGPASLVRLITSVIYTMTGSIALVMLMYGAFLVTTSKGSSSQVKRGKSIIIKTIVGTIIVFSAVFIVETIAKILRIPGFGN